MAATRSSTGADASAAMTVRACCRRKPKRSPDLPPVRPLFCAGACPGTNSNKRTIDVLHKPDKLISYRQLYAVGPNHGQVIEVSLDGTIHQVIDISASLGHIVPTAITFHDGKYHVGNLGTFESAAGTSQILDISR